MLILETILEDHDDEDIQQLARYEDVRREGAVRDPFPYPGD